MKERIKMISRIAIIGIIVEEKQSISKINVLLSECRDVIIGRLGIPYDKRGINVISIVVDAPITVARSDIITTKDVCFFPATAKSLKLFAFLMSITPITIKTAR